MKIDFFENSQKLKIDFFEKFAKLKISFFAEICQMCKIENGRINFGENCQMC
mgnify:CR=1 FL=1